MSLFGDLFEEEDDSKSSNIGIQTKLSKLTAVKTPRPPRPSHGLCGIYNQGATCYMNSLLQSLVFTSDFRELLFALGQSELGKLIDKDKPNSKVRVIPIQLQRLFARLMLLNQQGVSTEELTDSFGWTNNEEFQQHDAQELNRILFGAIEDSLVGTSGCDIIKRLYHGITVNQIKCLKCGRISEREEDFLDLCLSLTGHESIQQSLMSCFIAKEVMEGSNQYRCDNCSGLVDAEKGAVIRRLPPVLTLSLLRFNFDYMKLERYKETGKCSFPMELDMADYCEKLTVAGNTEYELFSVVIHKGGTHGGHYYAYIRDIDALGKWTHPDEEEVCLPMDPQTGKVDFIEFDSPIELLQALLQQNGPHGMPVDKLASEMVKQTGVSWNKRFKKGYGPINKFLKKYNDKFLVNTDTNWVSLKHSGTTTMTMKTTTTGGTQTDSDIPTDSHPKSPLDRKRPTSPAPPVGHCWFNFDDSRVHPIRTADLEKQFSGKESAYMLFYRRKDLNRPPEAIGNPAYGISEDLIQEVLLENDKLQKEREKYEMEVNTIMIQVHFSAFYEHTQGALHPRDGCVAYIELTLDRRKPVSFMKTSITEMGGELVPEKFVIHKAKELPAGLHIYDCVSENEALSVIEVGILDKSKVFVWDGWQVDDLPIPHGIDAEPVMLTVTYGNPHKLSRGFPRNLSLAEVRCILEDLTGIPTENMLLSRLLTKGDKSAILKVTEGELSMTLRELKVTDGDHFIVENTQISKGLLAESVVAKQTQLISFIVENRCRDIAEDGWPVMVVDMDKNESIKSLKKKILEEWEIKSLEGGGRLRLDDENHGLRPPLAENQSIENAGLKQGQRLIIEQGAPPSSEQITLIFTRPDPDCPEYEVTIDRKMTVQACLSAMIKQAKLQGEEWHLRKTNWCGEAGDVIEDLEIAIDQCHLRDGDLLLLEPGQLPPKGFIKVSVSLCKATNMASQSDDSSGVLAWITNSIQGLWSSAENGSGEPADEAPDVMKLSDIIIWKEATLADLKLQIQSLPQLASLDLPSVNFLRLRLLESGRPATVLRGNTVPLLRLKLATGSELVAQVLPQEEDLDPTTVLLLLERRVVETRTYFPAEEFLWHTSNGATCASLRKAVANYTGIALDKLVIAKHIPEKYQWMVMKDTANQKGKNSQKKKQKENLKKAPYFLKDGDVIGVKDLAYDPQNKDDFATEQDEQGQRALQKEIEEKKRKREDLRKQNELSDMGISKHTQKRREVGIRIHVGDFR